MTQAVVEVSRLAPSVSFYAAITQPFGIQYLSTGLTTGNKPCSYFGFPALPSSPHEVILTLAESRNPKPTTISFQAKSRDIVQEFIDRATRSAGAQFDLDKNIQHSATASIGEVYDADGNMIESKYTATGRRASEPVTAYKPAPKPTSRIETWRESVDKLTAASLGAVPRLTRTTTDPLPAATTSASKPDSEGVINGISNQTLFGTILGAAAGAAVAYALVYSEDTKSNKKSGVSKTAYAESTSVSRVHHEERQRYYSPQPTPAGGTSNLAQDNKSVTEDKPEIEMRDNVTKSVVHGLSKSKTPSQVSETKRIAPLTSLAVKSSNTVVSTASKHTAKPEKAVTTLSIRNPPLAPEPPRLESRVSKVTSGRSKYVESTHHNKIPQPSILVSDTKPNRSTRHSRRRSDSSSSYTTAKTSHEQKSDHHHHHHHHHRSSRHRRSRDKEQYRDEDEDENPDHATLVEVYDLPEPGTTDHNRVALAVAGIEAQGIPLPASEFNAYNKEDDTKSFYTSISNPFSDSKALAQQSHLSIRSQLNGKGGRNEEIVDVLESPESVFDIGAPSVAPSDSVSCAGSKRERIGRVQKAMERALKQSRGAAGKGLERYANEKEAAAGRLARGGEGGRARVR